ncbi:MAG: hypothetical protein HEQ19_13950 [Gloeotrichia echinulata CP02]|jgi:hypothetical protein|nr:hypothetical protein [Gloeotrichia echinulata DEX184]
MTVFNPKKWKFSLSRSGLQILNFSAAALALWIAYLNIGPYAFAVQKIGTRVIDQALIQGFYQLWFFGKIFQAFGLISHWLLGLLIWFIIQLAQVAPILIKHSRKYMRNVINDANSGDAFQIKDNDNAALKALKKAYNLLPLQGIRKARIASKTAYGVDACLCLIAYPPIAGGNVLQLLFALAMGQWSRIDWVAVLLTLITMLCMEVLLEGYLWWTETARYMK